MNKRKVADSEPWTLKGCRQRINNSKAQRESLSWKDRDREELLGIVDRLKRVPCLHSRYSDCNGEGVPEELVCVACWVRRQDK